MAQRGQVATLFRPSWATTFTANARLLSLIVRERASFSSAAVSIGGSKEARESQLLPSAGYSAYIQSVAEAAEGFFLDSGIHIRFSLSASCLTPLACFLDLRPSGRGEEPVPIDKQ